jgi:tRNA A37 methylthiotransferase MiaB
MCPANQKSSLRSAHGSAAGRSLAFNQSPSWGKSLPVIVDERARRLCHWTRTPYDALEVDNLVHVADPHKRLLVGEFHWVRVVDAAEYDLWAEAV